MDGKIKNQGVSSKRKNGTSNIKKESESFLLDKLHDQTNELARANFEIQDLKDKLNRTETDLSIIRKSTMWNLTLPIRVVVDIIKKMFRYLFRFLSLLKKALIYLLKNGIKKTIRKIKNISGIKNKIMYSEGNSTIDLEINNNMPLATMLNAHFRDLQMIPALYTESSEWRLNLVTDCLEKNSLLGGVATALIIATKFANENNFKLRIITRNSPGNPTNYLEILRINNVQIPDSLEFYSDYDRDVYGNKNFKLEISDKDVFLATSWWSAVAIKKTTIRKKFYYIIQEVETFFYPHGDNHYMCTEILNDENINFIVNTKYLFDYFSETVPNITKNGIYFEPAFSKNLYKPSKINNKKKKLFFYSRHNNPRNMYYYGLKIINLGIERGIINLEEWDIYCAGADMPNINLTSEVQIVNLGLMDWTAYAEFIGTVDLALSLMYTPHPSYVPYDIACSGGVVLSNKCANKEEFEFNKNVILSDLNIEIFMVNLEKAIELANDSKTRDENMQNSTIIRDWSEALNDVLNYMKETDKYDK